MFKDRVEAAQLLLPRLQALHLQQPQVLAIARGAAPMGHWLAQALHCPWDVLLVRKISAPGFAELAIGAVDESGWTWVAPQAERWGGDAAWIEAEKQRQLALMRERRARYSPGQTPPQVQGRSVVVVDDGLATGATMTAALHAVRAQHPARLVCAVPVASTEALAQVRPLCDELVCLQMPPGFEAVGQFYARFDQVSDDEVMALLGQHKATALETARPQHRPPSGRRP